MKTEEQIKNRIAELRKDAELIEKIADEEEVHNVKAKLYNIVLEKRAIIQELYKYINY